MLQKPQLDKIGQEALAMADYIEEHGWCQGTDSTVDGRVCLRGAVQAIRRNTGVMTNLYDILLKKLGGSVTRWNDTPGRTKEQVIEMLKEFAYNRQIKE